MASGEGGFSVATRQADMGVRCPLVVLRAQTHRPIKTPGGWVRYVKGFRRVGTVSTRSPGIRFLQRRDMRMTTASPTQSVAQFEVDVRAQDYLS